MNTRFLEAFNARDRARRKAAALASSAPLTSIADPRFVYVMAQHTDIRQTFARIRREGSLLIQPTAKAS